MTMDPVLHFELLEVSFSSLRVISQDVLLPVVAVLLLLFSICFVAWRRTVQRARVLKDLNVSLDNELCKVRATLDGEIKWRLAGETLDRRYANSTNKLEPKSTKELQELLTKENFDVKQPALKYAITQDESQIQQSPTTTT